MEPYPWPGRRARGRGSRVAGNATDAIEASPLTVTCVLDRHAVDAVLDLVDDRLRDAALVNLTSSTPEDARAIATRVTQAGGRYLDGKIMVPPPLVGTDHIVEASKARDIDTTVPEVSRTLAAAAVAHGHGRDGYSRIFDLLRHPTPTATR